MEDYSPKHYLYEAIAAVRQAIHRPLFLVGWATLYLCALWLAFCFQAVVWALGSPEWAEPTWPHALRYGGYVFAVAVVADWTARIYYHGPRRTLEETKTTNWRNRV
jgi:hypothetical protein